MGSSVDLCGCLRQYFRDNCCRWLKTNDVSIEKKICELVKPNALKICSQNCLSRPQSILLDFDKIKDLYCHIEKQPSLSSVDGIALSSSQNVILFVELKSWQAFLQFNKKNVSVQICKQTKKYDFKKKYEDSLKICFGIGQLLKASDVPICYAVVIDVKSNMGIAQLAMELDYLASQPSPSFVDECIAETQKKMNSQLNVKHVTHKCIFCEDFDTFIKSI